MLPIAPSMAGCWMALLHTALFVVGSFLVGVHMHIGRLILSFSFACLCESVSFVCLAQTTFIYVLTT